MHATPPLNAALSLTLSTSAVWSAASGWSGGFASVKAASSGSGLGLYEARDNRQSELLAGVGGERYDISGEFRVTLLASTTRV